MHRASKLLTLLGLFNLGCDDGAGSPAADAAVTSDSGGAGGGGGAGGAGGAEGDAALDSGPVDGSPSDGAPTDEGVDAALLPDGGAGFGAACADDAACRADLVCRSVGMQGMLCTRECSENADCPEGSQGRKCNMMGLCRP